MTLPLTSRQIESTVAEGFFELQVIQGVDRGKRSVARRRDTFVIGCGPDADLRLSDPTIAETHVKLTRYGDTMCMEDMTGSIRTKLGGYFVRTGYLSGDAVLGLGRTVLSYREFERSPQTREPSRTRFGSVVGVSLKMRRVFVQLEELANKHIPVLLQGPSGTGKVRLAHSLHKEGPRHSEPISVAS